MEKQELKEVEEEKNEESNYDSDFDTESQNTNGGAGETKDNLGVTNTMGLS